MDQLYIQEWIKTMDRIGASFCTQKINPSLGNVDEWVITKVGDYYTHLQANNWFDDLNEQESSLLTLPLTSLIPLPWSKEGNEFILNQQNLTNLTSPKNHTETVIVNVWDHLRAPNDYYFHSYQVSSITQRTVYECYWEKLYKPWFISKLKIKPLCDIVESYIFNNEFLNDSYYFLNGYIIEPHGYKK